MKILLILTFILMLGTSSLLNVAFACSCSGSSLDRHYQDADYVFLGKIEKIELNTPPNNDVFVNIERFWKGVESDSIVLQTHMHGATCGISFKQNQTYLIFADKSESGVISSHLCGGTTNTENLKPYYIFLLDNNLQSLDNFWIKLLIFSYGPIWILIIGVGITIFFLLRKRRSSKIKKNRETNEKSQ